jgi:TolA-binding protein
MKDAEWERLKNELALLQGAETTSEDPNTQRVEKLEARIAQAEGEAEVLRKQLVQIEQQNVALTHEVEVWLMFGEKGNGGEGLIERMC